MIPMSLVREDDPIDVEPFACPDPTDQGACPIRAGDLIPEVAVDDRIGTLYAVWMDARFDGGLFVEDHDNIAFTQSTNGGATWSPAIKVNKTRTTEPNYDQQAFTPSVDVDRRRHGDGHLLRPAQQRRGRSRRGSTRTTSPSPASRRSESCASAGELGGGADHAHVVRHPQGAVRARLLPRRLHGTRQRRHRLHVAVRPGVRTERREPVLQPARIRSPRGGGPARARRLTARRTCQ